jgi:hypothetical protein
MGGKMVNDALPTLHKRADVVGLRLFPLLPGRIKRGIVSPGKVVWRVAEGGIQFAFFGTKSPTFPSVVAAGAAGCP